MAFMDFLPQFSDNVDQTSLDDANLQAINLKRKLALADSLRNTPELQGQMVSGHYVAPSWTQSLANVANKYIGNKIAEKSMKDYAEAQKAKQAKMADILTKLTPHTEDVQLDTVQAGGMPGVMQTQQVKPDINAAIQGLTELDPSFGAKIAETRIAKALTPKEPMKIGAGEVLLDENYKPIYSAPFKPHENAPLIKTMRVGTNEVTQQWNDKTQKWDEIARGPAFKPEAETAVLTPQVLDTMAEQALAGDKSVFTGLGRGAQGAKNIVALRTAMNNKMLENGWSGKDIAAKNAEFIGLTSGQRTLGTRTANIEMAGTEFNNMIPLAREASALVPRSGFLPFGKANVMFDEQTNDPALRQFAAANNSLVNTYARAISPTGQPTIHDKEHAREMLSTAFDQRSYNATLDQLEREIAAARKSPGQVRESFNRSITGRPEQSTAAPGSVRSKADEILQRK